MNDKKKKFIVPEVEIVDYVCEDIITFSGMANNAFDWGGDDNTETLPDLP